MGFKNTSQVFILNSLKDKNLLKVKESSRPKENIRILFRKSPLNIDDKVGNSSLNPSI